MTVNMHEAKSQLSKLVESARLGEEVLIAKNGVPVAKLVPVESPRAERVFGQAKGKVSLSPDFHAPLTDSELEEFLGG